MRYYDYEKAKNLIEENNDKIVRAFLGIKEDWFWTAEPVWENGKYILDLDDKPNILGIKGSKWGTPAIRLYYEGGENTIIECYYQDGEQSEKPDIEFGPLSGPAQERIENGE